MPRGKAGVSPNMARGAKSRANLKRGGQHGRVQTPAKQKHDAEIMRLSKQLLLDPTYRRNLRSRLRSGRLQPGVEVALYYYAFGKPKEVVETIQPVPVRIVHEYDE